MCADPVTERGVTADRSTSASSKRPNPASALFGTYRPLHTRNGAWEDL